MALLELRGVSVWFGGVQALRDVGLDVEKGRISGLIGPNGAGKTTLFNVISGVLLPSTGRVGFDGRDITATSSAERCHAGIARTFQIVQPFSRLSAVENVAVAHLYGSSDKGHAPSRSEAVSRGLELLELGKLGAKAHWPAAALTLSERKRLEMVRALATNAQLLLLDEVLAGLNARETDEMMEIILSLRERLGLAILMVEHNIRAVTALADALTVLDFGTVVAQGATKSVLAEEAVIRAYVGERSLARDTGTRQPGSSKAESPLLEVEGLAAAYGELQVVWNVGFVVRRGELVALIGPNGAGKSTTLKALAGLIDIKAGRIEFCGKSLKLEPPHSRIRHGISLVPEGRRLFMNMSVRENLEMGGIIVPPPDGIRKGIERIFELFPILAEKQRQPAGTLSGGQQQMLAIGMGLISRPKLLVLDEPSLGLAPLMVEHLYRTIAALRRDGLTILLVEQQVFLALEFADRVYVIENGRVCLEGDREHLMENAHIQEHYFGNAPAAMSAPGIGGNAAH
ncbi:MAG: ATP-binding cassette domain-containing protein [Betaproteobacteria bacterium]|nr:ATP-binding cassette domain-containing protein [Betaproteobacteria bacterium]